MEVSQSETNCDQSTISKALEGYFGLDTRPGYRSTVYQIPDGGTDAGISVDRIAEIVRGPLSAGAKARFDTAWPLAVAIVEALTEKTSLRTDKSLQYERHLPSGEIVHYHGRLATKIEHLDRVSKNLDAFDSEKEFWRNFEKLDPFVQQTLQFCVPGKAIDRVHNIVTLIASTNPRYRFMAGAEIERWRSFLKIPLIPEELRSLTLKLLEGEEAMIRLHGRT